MPAAHPEETPPASGAQAPGGRHSNAVKPTFERPPPPSSPKSAETSPHTITSPAHHQPAPTGPSGAPTPVTRSPQHAHSPSPSPTTKRVGSHPSPHDPPPVSKPVPDTTTAGFTFTRLPGRPSKHRGSPHKQSTPAQSASPIGTPTTRGQIPATSSRIITSRTRSGHSTVTTQSPTETVRGSTMTAPDQPGHTFKLVSLLPPVNSIACHLGQPLVRDPKVLCSPSTTTPEVKATLTTTTTTIHAPHPVLPEKPPPHTKTTTTKTTTTRSTSIGATPNPSPGSDPCPKFNSNCGPKTKNTKTSSTMSTTGKSPPPKPTDTKGSSVPDHPGPPSKPDPTDQPTVPGGTKGHATTTTTEKAAPTPAPPKETPKSHGADPPATGAAASPQSGPTIATTDPHAHTQGISPDHSSHRQPKGPSATLSSLPISPTPQPVESEVATPTIQVTSGSFKSASNTETSVLNATAQKNRKVEPGQNTNTFFSSSQASSPTSTGSAGSMTSPSGDSFTSSSSSNTAQMVSIEVTTTTATATTGAKFPQWTGFGPGGPPHPQNHGLPQSDIIAISVSAAIVCVAAIGAVLAFLLCRRNRKRRSGAFNMDKSQQGSIAYLPVYSAMQTPGYNASHSAHTLPALSKTESSPLPDSRALSAHAYTAYVENPSGDRVAPNNDVTRNDHGSLFTHSKTASTADTLYDLGPVQTHAQTEYLREPRDPKRVTSLTASVGSDHVNYGLAI